jgi:DNA polymerase III epsilon subunit-like protein
MMEDWKFKKLELQAEKCGKVLNCDEKLIGEKIKVWYLGYYNNNNPIKIISKTCSFDKKGAESYRKAFMEDKNFSKYFFRLVEFDMAVNNINLEPNELDIKVQPFIKSSALKSVTLYSFADIKEYVAIDTETTGIGTDDQVVDIAAIRVVNDEIKEKFQRFIIPTIRMNKKAEDIHGLSQDFLCKNGRPAQDVFKEFKVFLDGLPVIGHNVFFDKRMIETHSKSVGVPIKLNIAFCTLQLSRKILDLNSHKLQDIVEKFNLNEGLTSHSALDDAIASKRYADLLKNTRTI